MFLAVATPLLMHLLLHLLNSPIMMHGLEGSNNMTRKRMQFATQLPVDTVALERKFRFLRLLVLLQAATITVLLAISFYFSLTIEPSEAYLTTHSGRIIPVAPKGTSND